MNWFSMDNLFSATLSGLFVSIVGAWIIKRFIGGGETNGNSSRITHRPIFSSVHVRIDSDFLKTSFTIFCVIIVSIYMFVQISKTHSTLSNEPGALQTQLSSLQATLQPQKDEKFKTSTLSITGEPVPVNFPAGSYGTDVTVQSSTRYQLQADALQTMNLVVVGQKPENVEAAVYDQNGNPQQL
jgi:hypothetical protein